MFVVHLDISKLITDTLWTTDANKSKRFANCRYCDIYQLEIDFTKEETKSYICKSREPYLKRMKIERYNYVICVNIPAT